MKSAQSTQIMAAPLASLFLILSLCAASIKLPQATGERLILTRLIRDPATDCNERSIMIDVGADSTVLVNGHRQPIQSAIADVSVTMQNRAERYIFFWADPETRMGDVENAMAHFREASEGFSILLLTASQRHQLQDPHNRNGCIVPADFDTLQQPAA